ncbi:hypothetical protein, partial [Serratia sp. C2(2)]|uniref:hypothetical protein n=1 Tax=Serratia sp. C2(2) TaxID=3117678 RepID=UPI002ED6BCC6|nr:hypothetical protein [Serratia sp. C2(2)]
RHQRESTGMCSYSQATGRWPLQARQSLTSFCFYLRGIIVIFGLLILGMSSAINLFSAMKGGNSFSLAQRLHEVDFFMSRPLFY